MAGGRIVGLSCLDYCCDNKYPDELLLELLSEEEYKRYKRYVLSLEIDCDKNLIHCPNNDCDTAVSLKEKPLQCKVCKTEICKKCKL